MVLMLWVTWRWMVLVRMPPFWAAAGFAGLVFCPLVLASTTLLHLDGLLGIMELVVWYFISKLSSFAPRPRRSWPDRFWLLRSTYGTTRSCLFPCSRSASLSTHRLASMPLARKRSRP